MSMGTSARPGYRFTEIGSSIEHEVSYRDVKYARLEFKSGRLLLVLPRGLDPQTVLEKHSRWIRKKSDLIQECMTDAPTRQLADRSEVDLRATVDGFVRIACQELCVEVNNVYLRKMNSKWASCSARGNLTFNRLMRYLPSRLIEYVAFHETAHRIERRHSEQFRAIVARRFDDHRNLDRELFAFWFLVQAEQRRQSELAQTLLG